MAEPDENDHTGGGNRHGRKASFGSIRQRDPQRFQSRSTGPDGLQYAANSPGGSATLTTKADANGALAKIRVEIDAGTWLSPAARAIAEAAAKRGPLRLGEYAGTWLAQRPLATRTRDHYRSLLNAHLLPHWHDAVLTEITSSAIRQWHGGTGQEQAAGAVECLQPAENDHGDGGRG